VAIEAGRVLLNRLREMANAKMDFAFETTLSGRTYAVFLSELIAQGYEFHLLYIWVRSADVAVERVHARVRRGGHNVPEDQVRRRYERSRHNFVRLYSPLASSWSVFDNTERPIVAVADGGRDKETRVFRQDLWASFAAGAV
jgi:predicted ABC-type ATPase